MSTLEMLVNMDCHGCEKKVRRALKNLEGVDDIEIDMDTQKVTVTGSIEQEKVLKVVRKTGRSVELWPISYNSDCFGGFIHEDLYPNHSNSTNSEHYDHEEQLPYSTTHSETPFVAFNDENANACYIM